MRNKTVNSLDEKASAFTVHEQNRKRFAERFDQVVSRYKSASEVARLVGVSESVVRKWRTGVSEPTRENIERIVRELGVSLEWLVMGTEPNHARDHPAGYHAEAAPQAAAAGKLDDRDAFDPELLRSVVRAMQQYEEDYGKTIKTAERPDLTVLLYQVASRLADHSEHAVARTVIDILQRAA